MPELVGEREGASGLEKPRGAGEKMRDVLIVGEGFSGPEDVE